MNYTKLNGEIVGVDSALNVKYNFQAFLDENGYEFIEEYSLGGIGTCTIKSNELIKYIKTL